MIIRDGIDYEKTVSRNRLVSKRQAFIKVSGYLSSIFITVIGTWFAYKIFKTQTLNNPTQMDYVSSVAIPLLILLAIYIYCRWSLNRDQLREIEIHVNIDKAKDKLVETAKNLQWKTHYIRDHYIIMEIKGRTYWQNRAVTLVIFPDYKIYFNSLGYYGRAIDGGITQASFDDDFQELVKEYLRIEKE